MFFSKKVLFGSLAALATTTVVVGTAVGVSVSQNSVNNETGKSEQGGENSNPQPETNGSNSGVNQGGNNQVVEPIDLKKLAATITATNIGIKPVSNEGEIEPLPMPELMPQNLYAFNVQSQELTFKKPNNFPQEVQVTFDLNSADNTVANLNNGMLKVGLTLKDTTPNRTEQNTHHHEVRLTTFKKVDVMTNFPNLFEEETFVLNITPMGESATNFTTIEELNNQAILVANPTPRRELENRNTQTTTGLNQWLKKDTSKTSHLTDISIEGLVKLEKISGNEEGTKAYFHLVSKDASNRIKLVKKGKEGEGNLEVAIAEIKTTNLLATDISVIPTNIDETGTTNFTNALKALGSEEEANKKYLTDKQDPSLNRELSVDLTMGMEETPLGSFSTPANKLYIKPYATPKPEGTDVSLSVLVSFGSGTSLKTFNTSVEKEREELKAAGFSFGLFSKKLDESSMDISATTFTSDKDNLEMYFKTANYMGSVDRPNMSSGSYPGGFALTSVDKDSLETGFMVKVMASPETPFTSENWVTFADYRYSGIEGSKVLYTPVISLIRVEPTGPVV